MDGQPGAAGQWRRQNATVKKPSVTGSIAIRSSSQSGPARLGAVNASMLLASSEGQGGCMHAAWDELDPCHGAVPRCSASTADYRLFGACTPCVDVAACVLAQNIQWWLNQHHISRDLTQQPLQLAPSKGRVISLSGCRFCTVRRSSSFPFSVLASRPLCLCVESLC